ncbi:MAG: glycosyltransferase family A protein [Mangrovicoccus sp.]
MADLAVLVTMHSETVIAGPSFRSADDAIAEAEKAGFTVERLIGVDNATPETEAYLAQPYFDNWRKIPYSFKDQGLVRNALAEAATAKWLAFLDADDLFSENWLVEAATRLKAAEEAGEKLIVHPEFNWFFEGIASLLCKIGQDDPNYAPYYYYFGNYYDALCVAPRQAHLDHPYAKRDIPNGFAREDWQWSIETTAGGWFHEILPDTVIFKRRQADSQSGAAGRRQAQVRDLEAMRIDQIRTLGVRKTN